MRPVIDGHNDVLTHLHDDGAADDALLTDGAATITVPSARAGGLAAGLFAVLPPAGGDWVARAPGGWDVPYSPSVPWEEAARTVGALGARLMRLLRATDGAIRLVRDVADLDACLAGDALGVIFHMEGAEPIDPDLDALDVWYAAGLRSLGPVWSRANAFGHGVPFRYPASPDTGPGLTDAGVQARAALRRARHRRRPQPPQRRRVLGRRARARRAADRLALVRPRALPVDAQPDRRPARRDRGRAAAWSASTSTPARCAPTAPTTPTRRSSGSPSTRATWPTAAGSTTWRWARTSTARRCPPRSRTPPACRACWRRSRAPGSAPSSSTRSLPGTGGACSPRPGR